MNPTTSTRSYYPALDGLRGIAILLVICCHNFDFIPYFGFGWIGVDLFFVLSGFLITDLLLKARDERNCLRNFYIRRILRIFPLYYGVLLLFFILAPLSCHLEGPYNYYHSNQPFLWLHLQNWLHVLKVQSTDSMPLSHFWSLSVEEQFYLFWPLLVISVRNTRLLRQIVILVLITCVLTRVSCWFCYGDGPTTFYFRYMTRLDGLCIGSLITLWKYDTPLKTGSNLIRLAFTAIGVEVLLLLVSKTIGPFPHLNFIGYTIVAAIFGIIVLYTVDNKSIFRKYFLENGALKYIGRISYGLYVFHWPLLVLFKIYLLNQFTDAGIQYKPAYILTSLAALAAAVLASVISYHLLEKRLLALKDVVTQEGFFARAWKRLLLFFNPTSVR